MNPDDYLRAQDAGEARGHGAHHDQGRPWTRPRSISLPRGRLPRSGARTSGTARATAPYVSSRLPEDGGVTVTTIEDPNQ